MAGYGGFTGPVTPTRTVWILKKNRPDAFMHQALGVPLGSISGGVPVVAARDYGQIKLKPPLRLALLLATSLFRSQNSLVAMEPVPISTIRPSDA